MTKARNEQVSLEATPFYHCYVRCVRRAFLCGVDKTTGENYQHRKQWIESRLKFLSYVYAIDICAYAVMSNHYHVVLHVDKARAQAWSKEDVVERWTQLFNGDLLVNRWLKSPELLDAAQTKAVFTQIEKWRERLFDISWFMRNMNETIARMANQEENCKGRFWEGRYKSQALLDDGALLTCMAYVDLNPVRASICDDLAKSDFTSIQQRLHEYAQNSSRVEPATAKYLEEGAVAKQALVESLKLNKLPQQSLMPFCGSAHTSVNRALPFTYEDYFQLVDATGRLLREGKSGNISQNISSIVARFGLNPGKWLEHVRHFNRRYGWVAGAVQKIRDCAALHNSRWAKGISTAGQAYKPDNNNEALVFF